MLGAAAQLQQPELWPWEFYAFGALAAILLLAAWTRMRNGALGLVVIAVAATLLSASVTGWRATSYASGALDPAVEGRDVIATGLVAALPQHDETGVRFRFQLESATLDGVEVALPRHWILGWYGGAETSGDGRAELQRAPAELKPGDRWRFAARLKAPHGHVNPHGFDYELWLWEQGVQATGYVRAGPRDVPPQRLASTWHKPVEQARLRVRDAIFRQVPDPRQAGVLAALVVGDQSAIERGDWEVFRATGVAHLMRFSGSYEPNKQPSPA